MIGDEPKWLVNLIITISLLPLLIGSLAEHTGTQTLLVALLALFLLMGLYTVTGGKLVDPPRPKTSSEQGIVQTRRKNPFALHASEGEEPESGNESIEGGE